MLNTPKKVKLRCAGCRAEILIDLQTASKSMHCSDCGTAIDKFTHPEFVAAIDERNEAARHRAKLERQRKSEKTRAQQEPTQDVPTLPYATKPKAKTAGLSFIRIVILILLFAIGVVSAEHGDPSFLMVMAGVAIFLGVLSVIASSAGRSLSRVLDIEISCPKCGTLSARQGGGEDHWAKVFALFPLSLLWALAPRPWHCPACGHVFR